MSLIMTKNTLYSINFNLPPVLSVPRDFNPEFQNYIPMHFPGSLLLCAGTFYPLNPTKYVPSYTST